MIESVVTFVRYEPAVEQIEAVRRTTPNALFGHIVSAASILVAGWDTLPRMWLLGWFLYVLATCGLVYIVYRRSMTRSVTRRIATAKLIFSTILLSAPWTLFSLVSIGNLPHETELVLIAVVASIASNGSIYRASVPQAAAVYVAMMMFPVIGKALFLDEHTYKVLAVLMAGYLFFLATAIKANTMLWRQRAEAHALNSELIAQHPGGVVMLDANCQVLLMNSAAGKIMRMSTSAEASARQDFVTYLERTDVPGLADRDARKSLLEFRDAVVKRQNAHVHLEFIDETAVALVGTAMAEGRYLVLLHDVTLIHLENKRIAANARRDPLTQVFNRTGLQQHLDALCEKREAFALLAIDLDKFKSANDTYGHAAGDKVLKEVAVRLTDAVREDDIVARVGGDEFIIVLRSGATEANAVATRIEAAIAEPVEFEGHAISIGASVGIACSVEDGETPDELMRKADKALYRAKRSRQQARGHASAA